MKAGKNQQVIRRLIEAVSDNDRERVLSFFSDDSKFRALDGCSAVGREAIWNSISASNQGAEKVDWQIDQFDEDEGGKVRTVGTVRYLKNGRWSEYPFCGAFEVRGSKVMQWL